MSEQYDRQGRPIDLMTWAKQLEKERRVAETTLPDGKWVSTVYIGLDHGFGKGPPLIFETMVFPARGEYGELDCDRYSSEEEALRGHKIMVEKWSTAVDARP